MSNSSPHEDHAEVNAAETPSRGANLWLIYSLAAFALLAAIGLAVLIVLPFYHRH